MECYGDDICIISSYQIVHTLLSSIWVMRTCHSKHVWFLLRCLNIVLQYLILRLVCEDYHVHSFLEIRCILPLKYLFRILLPVDCIIYRTRNHSRFKFGYGLIFFSKRIKSNLEHNMHREGKSRKNQ